MAIVNIATPATRVHTAGCNPYTLLAAAIIRRAALDARRGDAEARHWLLFSEWCALLLEALPLDRRAVRQWVLEL